MLIKHQTQPCTVSCVATCLAMLVDEPVQGLIERFHEKYREGATSMRQLLDELQVPCTSFDSLDLPLLNDSGAYLISVPSLNIQGGLHQIILEVFGENYVVLDPVKGREGKLFYGHRRETFPEAGEVPLNGFVVDCFITREWLEGRDERLSNQSGATEQACGSCDDPGSTEHSGQPATAC